MMKKFTLLASAFLLIVPLGQQSYAFETPFTDIGIAHENYDAIEYVKNEGIVHGYEDGTYKPDAPINRAEFTKIIMEAVRSDILARNPETEGYIVCDPETNVFFPDAIPFPDVIHTEWFAPFVCAASYYQVIDGFPDGEFKPGQDINFVEAAKIITIAFDFDYDIYDPWFAPFVQILEDRNAIPLSITSLDKKITRGEMAEMIYRLRANVTDQPSIQGFLTSNGGKVITHLVDQDEASCAYYRLEDLAGVPISLPEDVRAGFDCPGAAIPVLSNNGEFLIYADSSLSNVFLYDFENDRVLLLNKLSTNTDFSFFGFSSDDSKFALVATNNIDEALYPEMTKLWIFDISEIPLIAATQYDLKINFSCGSICSPGSEDVLWLDSSTIEYRTWDQVPYDLEFPDSLRQQSV